MTLLYVSTLDHIVHVMLPHLDAARAAGWRVEVACRVTRDPAITRAHCDGLHDLPLHRPPLHPANALALLRLVGLIRRLRPAIVHCHNPTGGLVGRLAATRAGTRPLRVYTAHGFHFHEGGQRAANAVYRTVEALAGRFLSEAVLTINREDFAAARTLMPPERVFFTHGVGVSAREDFDPARVPPAARQGIRDEFGVEEGGLLIACVGEMIPRKGHDDAIEALQRSGLDATLALVGEGPLRARLERRARRLGLEQRVLFPGFRRDIAPILAAADLFLFPSVQEGLPCAVQEALAMETPVVAYAIRGCRELVDDSCGRLVARGDRQALALALREVGGLDPAARRALGSAGRGKMLRLYDRAVCVAEVQSIYRKLREARG